MQQYDSGYAGRLYSSFKAATGKAQNTLISSLEELTSSLIHKLQDFVGHGQFEYSPSAVNYAFAGIVTADSYRPYEPWNNFYFARKRKGGFRHGSPSFKKQMKEERKKRRSKKNNGKTY